LEVAHILRGLSTQYAIGVDRRDRSYFLEAFHPDAMLLVDRSSARHPQAQRRMKGHDEIGEIIEWIAAYPKTFHMIGQSRYDVQDGAATGEVYCQANHYAVTDQGNVNRVMYIRYQDEYRSLGDGRWRIGSRHVLVDWTETHPVDSPVDRSRGDR
jgi:hypothetical protein